MPSAATQVLSDLADTQCMKWFLLCLMLLSLAGAGVAAATQNEAPEPPTHVIAITAQMPVSDRANGSLKEAGAQVPGTQEPSPAAPAVHTPNSSSVTVTATVLPSKTIYVAADGSIKIIGNTADASWWNVRSSSTNESLEMTEELWERARTCLQAAVADIGTMCTLKAQPA